MRRVVFVTLLLAGCGSTPGPLRLSFPTAEAQTVPGATLTVPLEVRWTGGEPAEVTLSARVDPPSTAVVPTLMPERVPPGESARLRVTVNPNAAAGSYRVTVSGKGGTTTATASLVVRLPAKK